MWKIFQTNDGSEHLSRMLIIAIAFVAIGAIIAAVMGAINSDFAEGAVRSLKDFMH